MSAASPPREYNVKKNAYGTCILIALEKLDVDNLVQDQIFQEFSRLDCKRLRFLIEVAVLKALSVQRELLWLQDNLPPGHRRRPVERISSDLSTLLAVSSDISRDMTLFLNL